MRTALDTNVLSALLSREASTPRILQELQSARQAGGLVISAPVYSELLAYPRADESFLTRFLDDTGILADFNLSNAVWKQAGLRYSQYAIRRRRSSSIEPRRLLADFIIGAHALLQAERLMTLDSKRYEQDFPELHLTHVQ